jgi:hypothetical protein
VCELLCQGCGDVSEIRYEGRSTGGRLETVFASVRSTAMFWLLSHRVAAGCNCSKYDFHCVTLTEASSKLWAHLSLQEQAFVLCTRTKFKIHSFLKGRL